MSSPQKTRRSSKKTRKPSTRATWRCSDDGTGGAGRTRGPLGVLFYFWDQLDLLTTTWPLLLFWIRPSFLLVAASIALVLVLHPLVALVGYLVGARRSAR